MRGVGVVRGTVAARLRHLAVNSKEATRVFPIKKRKPQGRCSFTLCAFSNLGIVVPLFFSKPEPKLSPLLATAAAPDPIRRRPVHSDEPVKPPGPIGFFSVLFRFTLDRFIFIG